MRQFIFSALACIVSVVLYFMLRPYFGIETLSWLCILGALPFGALGFVKYNGMTAEKFIVAWIRAMFIVPRRLLFKAENMYEEMIKLKKEGGKNKFEDT